MFFAQNFFIYALNQYATQGYTYIEVGDGDELWQNPHFHKVFKAHPRTFDLLHSLYEKKQLYMLLAPLGTMILSVRNEATEPELVPTIASGAAN